MNIFSDDDMWDMLFEILSNHQTGQPITSEIIKYSCEYFANNCKDELSTEDICDSVLGLFDYYNNYIEERNVNMQPIKKDDYDMTIIMLNAAINTILEEQK